MKKHTQRKSLLSLGMMVSFILFIGMATKPASASVSEKNPISFTLKGNKEETTFALDNLEVQSGTFRSIFIQFPSKAELHFESPPGWIASSNHDSQSKTYILVTSNTAEEIRRELSKITFTRRDTQTPVTGEVAITLSKETMTTGVDEQGIVHYYQYMGADDRDQKRKQDFLDLYNNTFQKKFNQRITWAEAYVLAKQQKKYGLTGYLATITSPEEQDLIYHQIAKNAGWLGGTRFLKLSADRILDDERISLLSNQYIQGKTKANKWYWATGPEAYNAHLRGDDSNVFYSFPTYAGTSRLKPGGELFDFFSNPLTKGHSLDGKMFATNPIGSTLMSGTGKEPNNADGIEGALQFAQNNKPTWNDLPGFSDLKDNIKGFYVEFSEYKGMKDTSRQDGTHVAPFPKSNIKDMPLYFDLIGNEDQREFTVENSKVVSGKYKTIAITFPKDAAFHFNPPRGWFESLAPDGSGVTYTLFAKDDAADIEQAFDTMSFTRKDEATPIQGEAKIALSKENKLIDPDKKDGFWAETFGQKVVKVERPKTIHCLYLNEENFQQASISKNKQLLENFLIQNAVEKIGYKAHITVLNKELVDTNYEPSKSAYTKNHIFHMINMDGLFEKQEIGKSYKIEAKLLAEKVNPSKNERVGAAKDISVVFYVKFINNHQGIESAEDLDFGENKIPNTRDNLSIPMKHDVSAVTLFDTKGLYKTPSGSLETVDLQTDANNSNVVEKIEVGKVEHIEDIKILTNKEVQSTWQISAALTKPFTEKTTGKQLEATLHFRQGCFKQGGETEDIPLNAFVSDQNTVKLANGAAGKKNLFQKGHIDLFFHKDGIFLDVLHEKKKLGEYVAELTYTISDVPNH